MWLQHVYNQSANKNTGIPVQWYDDALVQSADI